MLKTKILDYFLDLLAVLDLRFRSSFSGSSVFVIWIFDLRFRGLRYHLAQLSRVYDALHSNMNAIYYMNLSLAKFFKAIQKVSSIFFIFVIE